MDDYVSELFSDTVSAGGVFSSIANLRLLARAKRSIGNVFVTGYNVSGDGGGGSYYYDPIDTTSADNKGTVIVAADGARWKLRITYLLSVAQFGIFPDAVLSSSGTLTSGTDNGAAIAAVIAYAIVNKHGVWVPKGDYYTGAATFELLNGQLTGTVLQGEDMDATRFITNVTGTTPVLLATGGVGSATNAGAENLTIVPLNQYAGTGICLNCTIFNAFKRIKIGKMARGLWLYNNIATFWTECNSFEDIWLDSNSEAIRLEQGVGTSSFKANNFKRVYINVQSTPAQIAINHVSGYYYNGTFDLTIWTFGENAVIVNHNGNATFNTGTINVENLSGSNGQIQGTGAWRYAGKVLPVTAVTINASLQSNGTPSFSCDNLISPPGVMNYSATGFINAAMTVAGLNGSQINDGGSFGAIMALTGANIGSVGAFVYDSGATLNGFSVFAVGYQGSFASARPLWTLASGGMVGYSTATGAAVNTQYAQWISRSYGGTGAQAYVHDDGSFGFRRANLLNGASTSTHDTMFAIATNGDVTNTGPSDRIYIDSTGVRPAADNLYGLGTPTSRYSEVYSVGGVASVRVARVMESIAELRSFDSTMNTRTFLTGYTTAGDGGGGAYYKDASDTTSADNGGSIIVALDGSRWKLQFHSSVDIRQFGATSGDGTDDAAAIQNALNSGATYVDRPAGAYSISTYLLVPAGVVFGGPGTLTATATVPAYATWGTAQQGQSILLNGAGASVKDLIISGGNFKAGGIGSWTFARNSITGCQITNCGAAQAILSTGSTDQRIEGNFIQYAAHGIQMWQSSRVTVTGNRVRVVDGGGIWTADAADVDVTGNTVSDCGDVGIDFEGGANCVASGNTVRSCKNGEIAIFSNGTGSARVPLGLKFSSNVLYRTATYAAGTTETATACNTGGGAIFLASMTAGQEGIVFSDNTAYVAAGMTGIFGNDLGANKCGVSLLANTIYGNGVLHYIQRAYGLIGKGNVFHGLGASNASQNVYKNCDSGLWDNNTYDYESTKTTNSALYYYTDVAITTGPTISNNVFKNCATWAFKHDPYVSGISAFLTGNSFSDVAVVNGGVESTANGYPIYRNQALNILINENPTGSYQVSQDISALTALAGTTASARGTLGVLSGTLANMYNVNYFNHAVYSANGTGSGTGLTASTTRYAAFSGATVTLTGPDATLSGRLSLVLDSAA